MSPRRSIFPLAGPSIATHALGELFDQVAWAPDLFRRDAGYSAHFREIRDRFGPVDIALLGRFGLRAAMVHEGDSHESGRPSRPMRPAVPAVRSAFISERFNSRRNDRSPPRDLVPLSLRPSDPKSFVTLSRASQRSIPWAGDAWPDRLARSDWLPALIYNLSGALPGHFSKASKRRAQSLSPLVRDTPPWRNLVMDRALHDSISFKRRSWSGEHLFTDPGIARFQVEYLKIAGRTASPLGS